MRRAPEDRSPKTGRNGAGVVGDGAGKAGADDGAQIQVCTVGAARTLTLRLHLVEYDPISPVLYELEAARIHRALGALVIRIEHTGSTSVPGLAAKPIVDMLLVVPDSSDEDAYMPALVAAGYVLRIREPDGYEHRVFMGPDTDASLHVLSDGCEEIDKILVFRDWLRAHRDDLALYERRKRELIGRDWRFMQQYADAKTEVIGEIVEWARASDRANRAARVDA